MFDIFIQEPGQHHVQQNLGSAHGQGTHVWLHPAQMKYREIPEKHACPDVSPKVCHIRIRMQITANIFSFALDFCSSSSRVKRNGSTFLWSSGHLEIYCFPVSTLHHAMRCVRHSSIHVQASFFQEGEQRRHGNLPAGRQCYESGVG